MSDIEGKIYARPIGSQSPGSLGETAFQAGDEKRRPANRGAPGCAETDTQAEEGPRPPGVLGAQIEGPQHLLVADVEDRSGQRRDGPDAPLHLRASDRQVLRVDY